MAELQDMDEVMTICPVIANLNEGQSNLMGENMSLCLKGGCVFYNPPIGFKPPDCIAFNAVIHTKIFLDANELREPGSLARKAIG